MANLAKFENIYDFQILRDVRKREKLSISELSRRSGVSPAVISKLERNQTSPGLETLYRITRALGMNPSDFLALAETRTAHRKQASHHQSGNFIFDEVQYANIRCLHGAGIAGAKVSRPQIHRDEYELCWILRGKVNFYLPHEMHTLESGDSIQFDALLEHTYEAIEDSEIIILHIKKGNRF